MSDTTISSRDLLQQALQWRYATKQFDPARKIPAADLAALEQSLVLTPSSFGLQPWKFLIIQDAPLREQLVPVSWNQRQVADCSHLVVLTTKASIDEADVDHYLASMAATRGVAIESLAGFRGILVGFLAGHTPEQLAQWAARQSYIALGQLMTAAALLGIDTCPMEGFVPGSYDQILGLAGTGYTSTVVCPLGYRSPEDKYAFLPKVRFAASELIEHR